MCHINLLIAFTVRTLHKFSVCLIVSLFGFTHLVEVQSIEMLVSNPVSESNSSYFFYFSAITYYWLDTYCNIPRYIIQKYFRNTNMFDLLYSTFCQQDTLLFSLLRSTTNNSTINNKCQLSLFVALRVSCRKPQSSFCFH